MLKDYVNQSSQVSPTEYGHVLLVPRVLECLPQRIDHDSLLLALHLAVEIDHLGASSASPGETIVNTLC